MVRRVVISGCSGGGKSTLVAGLARQGITVFPEPGRVVVERALASGGDALPWRNMALFASDVIALASEQWATAKNGLNVYDRSLIDMVTWYERQSEPVPPTVAALADTCRYDPGIFMAPPGPDIFTTDDAGRHSFDDAVAEYEALLDSYPAKGYQTVKIPQLPSAARVAWMLAQLKED